MHGHHWIEQSRLTDSVGLKTQLEVFTIGVKGPGATVLRQLQARLIGTKQHLLAQLALAVAVNDGDGVVAHLLYLCDTHDLIRYYATELGVFGDLFKLQHPLPPCVYAGLLP